MAKEDIGLKLSLWFLRIVIYAGLLVLLIGTFSMVILSKPWGEMGLHEQFTLMVIFMVLASVLVTVIIWAIKGAIRKSAEKMAMEA